MKPFKLIPALMAFSALMFAGCEKEESYGLDESKPTPENVVYDAANSSASVLTVTWDADKAIKAGATTFVVQANTEEFTGGDNYDGDLSSIVKVTDETHYSVTFKKLTAGDSYYVRVRANYRNSKYSPWVYIKEGDSSSSIAINLEAPEITDLVATNKSATLYWKKVPQATSYLVEFRETGAAAWNTPAIECGDVDKIQIGGLSQSTSYDFRIVAKNKKTTSAYSKISSILTLSKMAFPVIVKSAEEFVTLFNGTDLMTAEETEELILDADIDLTGQTVNTVPEFNGIFKGQGHKISGLVHEGPLFKTINSASDVIFDATCSFTNKDSQFGTLAGESRGLVSGIENNGKITVSLTETPDNYMFIGGIVGFAVNEVKDCKNNGSIEFTGGAVSSTVIGGVVGFANKDVTGLVNTGDITMTASYLASSTYEWAYQALDKNKAEYTNYVKVPVLVGGVVGLAIGATTTDCTNSGTVTYTISSVEQTGVTSKLGRANVAGIVAGPDGDVVNCTNSGNINVSIVSSDRAPWGKYNYIAGVAGISGGNSYDIPENTSDSGSNSSNVINCTNTGNISFDFDASQSNSTAAGIVAWPGIEGAKQTVFTRDCINRGNVTISGNGMGRFGTIQGGAGNVSGCKNYGTITSSLIPHDKDGKAKSGAMIGGLVGYQTYNLKVVDCENYGDVINTEDGDLVFAGGLIGAYAGQDGNPGAGCIVKCNVSTKGTQKYTGMIMGRYNGAKKIALGTEDNPIKVSGSIKCGGADAVTIDAGNVITYAVGTERAASADRPVHAVYGE